MAIALRLYQAGTPLGDAVDGVITTASEVVDLPWDGALAASGSSIAVDVAAAGTNGDDAELQTVEWRPDLVASATPTDSGWLPLATAPVVLDLHALRQAPHLRQTATHPWLDGGGQLQQPAHQHWRLDLRDPTNPAGYLEVGKLAGGPGAALWLQDDFEVRRVATGAVAEGPPSRPRRWVRPGPSILEADLPLRSDSRAGIVDVLEALYGAVGLAGAFGLAILPAEDDVRQAVGDWVQLREGSNGVNYLPVARADSPRPWAWETTLRVRGVL